MEIIKQLSTDRLKQICNDGVLWNEYSTDQKCRSLLYRTTSLIQEANEDRLILTRDVLDQATVELLKRKQKNN